MILSDLRKELPRSLLISDCFTHSGRPLLLSLIRIHVARGCIIHYLKYDCSLTSEKADFELLKLHPISVDLSTGINIAATVTPLVTERETIIVLDSVSPLLLNISIGALLSSIKQILAISRQISVIALVHSDVHRPKVITGLDHGFSCHLKLIKPSDKRRICQGVLKKTSGKVIDSNECYNVSPSFDLIDLEPLVNKTVTQLPTKSAVPLSTFKLDLNAKEEVARSQVVLPYIRKQTSTSGSGQIIYEAEHPDWDDEDPDDDLEL